MSSLVGETEVIINAQPLTLAEEMTLWCAVNNFLISLREKEFREGLGESLAQSYVENLAAIAKKWLDAEPTTPKTRYAKDSGESLTMQALMSELGMMIDSGASNGDLAAYLDREFFGGAWGFLREYMPAEGRHHMRLFEADMRGAIVAAYDAALERNGSEEFQRFKLKLEVRMKEWKDQRAIDDVLDLLGLLPKPDDGRQPEMRYEHRVAPVKLDLAALARGESAEAELNPPTSIHIGNKKPAGVRPYIDMVTEAAAEQVAKRKEKPEPDLSEALGMDEPDGGWSRG